MSDRLPMPLEETLPEPPGDILPADFYAQATLKVARGLLGCLVSRRERGGGYSVGRIVETEAYVGEDDPACHAAAGLTPRTRVLYGPPGRAYVYFNYGMHHLLNAVTEPEGFPAAVLVRAARPVAGGRRMAARRRGRSLREWTSGPGRLCRALKVDLACNGRPLTGPALVVTRDGHRPGRVARGPRIGISRGTERPWRFWVEGDPWVSRPRGGS